MNKYKDPMSHPRVNTAATLICRLSISMTTLLAISCVLLGQYNRLNWQNEYIKGSSQDPSQIKYMHYQDEESFMEENKDEFKNGNNGQFFTKMLFAEVLILAMHPVPFFDRYVVFEGKKTNYKIVYFFSEVMMALMWLRIYFLIRTVMNYTDFMDAYSKKLCSSYGFTTSIFFTVKSRIIINPESTVMTILFGTIVIFAYLVRIFEMPYFRSIGTPVFDSYFNACWFSVVTLTTIGYGDLSPVSPPGRILTMILAFWGALLLSLVVVIVSSVFNLGEDEKMALRHLRLTKEAAKTITSGL